MLLDLEGFCTIPPLTPAGLYSVFTSIGDRASSLVSPLAFPGGACVFYDPRQPLCGAVYANIKLKEPDFRNARR